MVLRKLTTRGSRSTISKFILKMVRLPSKAKLQNIVIIINNN